VVRSTSVIDYRGRFAFDVPPDAIWSSIEHAERFESWWAWLREFRLEGPGLEEGSVLYGVVSPPVPYTMRIRVVLGHCTRPERIDATVHGDLEGHAHLVLEATDPGTLAEVSWTVEMTKRPMRLAARVGYPLLRWGHDRVIDATVSGYRRHLAAEFGESAATASPQRHLATDPVDHQADREGHGAGDAEEGEGPGASSARRFDHEPEDRHIAHDDPGQS